MKNNKCNGFVINSQNDQIVIKEVKDKSFLFPVKTESGVIRPKGVTYKDDLQEHDPFRPDDAWHSKQEEICENHSENLVKKAEKAIEGMPIRQKVIKQRRI